MTRIAGRHFGAAIAAGAIGGLIGGWFSLGWDVTSAPGAVGRMADLAAFVGLFTHAPIPIWLLFVTYFTISVLAGVVYGALVDFVPAVAIGGGIAFGIAIWLAAHEIVMPLLRLTAPVWQTPLREQTFALVGHGLWGLVIGVFYAYFRRRFAGPVPALADDQNVIIPVAESVSVF